jgi:transcriptional regulator with GAF, ATPase, and Fis domain
MLVDENKFFRDAVSAICRNLDLEVALQNCLMHLKSHMPADMCQLNIYDRGLETIRVLALATETEAKRCDIIVPLDDTGRKHIRETPVESTIIVDWPEAKALFRPFSKVAKMWPEYSMMVMHLSVQDVSPGNLVLYAKGAHRFTEKHRRLYSILNDPITIALSNIRRYDELSRLKDVMADDLQYLRKKLLDGADVKIIGEKFGLKGVLDMVREVAPLDSPVLLLGETGVGKEVIVNTIHTMSRRRDAPFIKVNCGAIPETLIDSELFGHEKGSFTGAVARKRGCFERAGGGTIFLDEVAELPLQAQVRMLRVLQEKKIVRVGGSEEIDVDIRVVAATHQNLSEMVAQNRFRADLHYRLNVFPIVIPPLRERKEDIPGLVHHFLAKKARELQIHNPPAVAPGAVDALFEYDWPGNVRELQNVVERALILNKKGPLAFNEIVWTEAGSVKNASEPDRHLFPSLDFVNARHIREALKATGGKISGPRGAAALLGINPNTLRHRMRKLGLYHGKKPKR